MNEAWMTAAGWKLLAALASDTSFVRTKPASGHLHRIAPQRHREGLAAREVGRAQAVTVDSSDGLNRRA